MFFTADETLLTVIAWTLAWLGGATLIVAVLAADIRQFLKRAVSSPTSLLHKMTNEPRSSEEYLPARCPVRFVSDCSEPPDRFQLRAENDLRGWQSDGR